MSAGIISANLPALRPAFRLIARKLGISGGFAALFRSTNGTRTKTTNGVTQASEAAESATAITQRSKQHRHSFYYLPDDSGSESEQTRMEASFRPDYDHAKTYTNVKGPQVGHRSGDGIPLSEIRVDKVFTQTATT